MKLKYLFAVSPSHLNMSSVPYGIALVATVAKKAGFDVQMLVGKPSEKMSDYLCRLTEFIKEENIDVVAVGGLSGNYSYTEQLIAVANAEGCITVLGGYIVDSAPQLVAQNIGATYCVKGEGEITFVELAKSLEAGSNTKAVEGLIYYCDGELIETHSRKVVEDLDTLPFIDIDLAGYAESLEYEATLFLMLSRSCPFQCTFCYHTKGAHYRTKGLDYFFNELDYYLENLGDKVTSLFICDDLFNVNKERILEFCKRIKKYHLPFVVQVRADFIDEEMLIALKEAGAYIVGYGLESASNKVLKSMNKKLTIEKIQEALKLTYQCELRIQANLILGDIEDDLDTIQESFDFYREYGDKYDLNITMIRVFPGTYLYKYAVEMGIIKDELAFIKADCPLVNVSKIPNEAYELLPEKCGNLMMAVDFKNRRPINKSEYEINIHRDGRVDYNCYCPHCYTKIEMKNLINIGTGLLMNRNNNRGCPQCNQRLTPQYSSIFNPCEHTTSYLIENLANALFEKYYGKRIAVWGMGPFMRKLILESQMLRNLLVKIVDKRYIEMKKEMYCGLVVEAPETLTDTEFDCLIIGVVNKTYEVLESLDKMDLHPSLIEIDKLGCSD